MQKYYLLQKLLKNGEFETSGLIIAKNEETAIKKAGLYRSNVSETGLYSNKKDESLVPVRLKEVIEILTRDQAIQAVSTVADLPK